MSATALELMDAYEKGYARGVLVGAVECDKLESHDRIALRAADGLVHPFMRIVIAWRCGYNHGWAMTTAKTLCSGEPTP